MNVVVSSVAVEQVVALYKYQRQNPDELSFEKGCVINVINKVESDWWTGELNGQTGLFPTNYVAPLSSVSESDQPPPAATCELFFLYLFVYLLTCLIFNRTQSTGKDDICKFLKPLSKLITSDYKSFTKITLKNIL